MRRREPQKAFVGKQAGRGTHILFTLLPNPTVTTPVQLDHRERNPITAQYHYRGATPTWLPWYLSIALVQRCQTYGPLQGPIRPAVI